MADQNDIDIEAEVNRLVRERLEAIAQGDRDARLTHTQKLQAADDEIRKNKEYLAGLVAIRDIHDGDLLIQKQTALLHQAELDRLNLILKEKGKLTDAELKQYEIAKDKLALAKELASIGDEINDDLKKTTSLYGSINKEAKKWHVAVQSGKTGILAVSKAMHGFDNIASKGLGKLKTALSETFFAVDSVTKQFAKATQLNDTYTDSITSTYKELNLYGTSLEEASKAQMDLVQNVTDFTLSSESQRNEVLRVTAVLGELGIATADVAKGVQGSMKYFGQSITQATNTAMELESTAEALGVVPGQMAAQYAQMGPAMAKFGTEGIKTFKELSRIQKITGLEMQKVLNLTNKFDTFEGAATQAGKLNAALGGNFVNAMDLMMATDPAERFGMIRDSILDAGLTFDDMSYYQKQFYTESLGLSDVGDLALMLSGDMNTLGAATNESAASLIEQKEKAQKNMEIMEQLKSVFLELGEVIMPLVKNFSDFLQTLQKSPNVVKGIMAAFIMFKALSIGLAIRNGMLATSFYSLAAAETAAGTAAKRSGTGLLVIALILGAIVAAMLINSPSLLVASMFGFAGSLKVTGKAADRSTPSLQRLAPALVQVGVGVLLITGGIAAMAVAFSLLSVEQMIGMGAALVGIGVGIYFLSPALAALGGTVALTFPALAGLALIVVAIGGAVAIAAMGVGLLATGIGKMFESVQVDKSLALTGLVVALALAGPGLYISALGLGALALGLGGVAFALALIPTRDLEAIALFTSSLANIEIGQLSKVAETIERVAKAMDSIPKRKTFLFTHVLETAAVTAAAISALSRPSGGSQAAAVSLAPAGAAAGSGTIANVTVEMHLDNRVFDTKVVKIVKRENEIYAQEVKRSEI